MTKSKQEIVEVTIKAPNFKIIPLTLVGTSFFVSNKFSDEARNQMQKAMEEGAKSKQTKNKKEPKNFEAGYQGSLHQAAEGWYGIPATAFRASLIRACSMVGVEMTKAKMCFFVEADGFEKETGTPLVKISKGKPERFDAYVRNANGSPDIRSRARFAPGWQCSLRIQYDADMFSESAIANVVQRAGISVGVGAGRPFSTMSAGQGWGTWRLQEAKEAA